MTNKKEKIRSFKYTANFLPMKIMVTGNYGVPAGFPRTISRENPVISTDDIIRKNNSLVTILKALVRKNGKIGFLLLPLEYLLSLFVIW